MNQQVSLFVANRFVRIYIFVITVGSTRIVFSPSAINSSCCTTASLRDLGNVSLPDSTLDLFQVRSKLALQNLQVCHKLDSASEQLVASLLQTLKYTYFRLLQVCVSNLKCKLYTNSLAICFSKSVAKKVGSKGVHANVLQNKLAVNY